MTVSSQCPSNVTRTSLTNLILPVMAFVNSPPPKNGWKKNSDLKIIIVLSRRPFFPGRALGISCWCGLKYIYKIIKIPFWELGYLGIWELGNLETWALGNMGTWELRNLGTYSRVLNNRVVYNKSPLWGNFGKYKRPGNN